MIEIFDRMTMGRAIIIGALLAAAYYFLSFDSGSGQSSAIQGSTMEIQRIQGEINKIDERLRQADEFQKASNSLGASIQKLLSYIPANFTIGQLMKTVSQEARVAGLDITRIQPKENLISNAPVEDFTELGVTVELRGQYEHLLNFMSSLTRKRQIFIFEKMDISSDAENADMRGMIKVSAEIHAFSYRGAE